MASKKNIGEEAGPGCMFVCEHKRGLYQERQTMIVFNVLTLLFLQTLVRMEFSCVGKRFYRRGVDS